MISEVEGHLLLTWRIGLVVAVVSHDGDNTVVTSGYAKSRQGDSDRQIAALVVLDLLAIDIDGLLAHDGLEMEGHVTACAFFGQHKMFSIPGNTLIVATTTGLSRHQLNTMRC